MNNVNDGVIMFGDRTLFPISWLYNEKIEVLRENFSKTIIDFLPSIDEFKLFCKKTKLQSKNIYLCTDPYNLFVYYDLGYLYIPIPFINYKIVESLGIVDIINTSASLFKNLIDSENYTELYSYINNDIKLEIFKNRYFEIPSTQRYSIFEDILNHTCENIDCFGVDIIDDVFNCLSKSSRETYLPQTQSIEYYSVHDEESNSYNSTWLSIDSAIKHSETYLKDASIYTSSIDATNILAIVNDRVYSFYDNVTYIEHVKDIVSAITNGDIIRNGYKVLTNNLISEFKESILSLHNFYKDNIFSASHSIKLLEIGVIQGIHMKLFNRDLRLLAFCLSFTGLCFKNEDFSVSPSSFLKDICLTNILPPGDSKIAKYIIDSYVLGEFNDEFILKYDISSIDRANNLKNIYLDILNLSFIRYDLFVEENLSNRISKRFISLWKNAIFE